MGKKPITVIISLLLIIASLSNIFYQLYKNKQLYTKKFDPNLYEKKFNRSQWVIPQSKNQISDEDLYAYSGYKYIKGLNPILNSPEVPPLGKYLVGTSILIFGNQRIFSIIFASLCLMVIAHLVFETTKSLFASSIAIFLTSIHSLFIDQVIHAPQMDIFQLFFLLLFFTFFFLYRKTSRIILLLLSGLVMGYFISTKIFFLSFAIMNAFILIFQIFNRDKPKKIIFNLAVLDLVSLFTYIMTYSVYFIRGGNLRSFLGVQKWIFLFYKSSSIQASKLLGSYLGLTFFNRWRYWTEGYPIIKYQYWNLLWPIIFILGTISLIKLLLNKSDKQGKIFINLITGFLLIYNIFLFISPIYPRYLLLLFIPLNMLIAIYFGKIFENRFNEN